MRKINGKSGKVREEKQGKVRKSEGKGGKGSKREKSNGIARKSVDMRLKVRKSKVR